jgi:hypothetical protein
MRRIRPLAAWLALVALVFAQLATAAYACPQMSDRPMAMQAGDCDRDMSTSPNLCERHCDYGNASVDNPKPAPAFAIASAFVRAVVAAVLPMQPRAETRARISTGPPPTRFTVLRI